MKGEKKRTQHDSQFTSFRIEKFAKVTEHFNFLALAKMSIVSTFFFVATNSGLGEMAICWLKT
jgi:hypothetical protein